MIGTNNIEIPYAAPIDWYRAWLNGMSLPRVPLNSCNIQCCGGRQALSVPLLGGRRKTRSLPYDKLQLSEHGNWRHTHWGALYSAYGRAPYFEYYSDILEHIYAERRETLAELNLLVHQAVCKVMQLDAEIPTIGIDPALNRTGQPYHQVWEEKYGFMPGLSILDLAFNMGPESLFYLL